MRQSRNTGCFRQSCTLPTVTWEAKPFPLYLFSVQECKVFWCFKKSVQYSVTLQGKELSAITSETPYFFLLSLCPLSFHFMENVLPSRDYNALVLITAAESHLIKEKRKRNCEPGIKTDITCESIMSLPNLSSHNFYLIWKILLMRNMKQKEMIALP